MQHPQLFLHYLLLMLVMAAWMTESLRERRDSEERKRLAINDIMNDIMDTAENLEEESEKLHLINKLINETYRAPKWPPESLDSFVLDDEGYYLAYKVTAKIGESVGQSYMAFGKNYDDNKLVSDHVPCGCTSVNSSGCPFHYRSVLLDLWSRLPVDKVRVLAYIQGEERLRLVFNGQGSDYISFFSQDRLLESPYTDLASASPTHFSFYGYRYKEDAQRRFYINNNLGGCEVDAGWLVVVDGKYPNATTCLWEQERNASIPDAYPKILFAQGSTFAVWDSENVTQADVLTISIKLANDSACPDNAP